MIHGIKIVAVNKKEMDIQIGQRAKKSVETNLVVAEDPSDTIQRYRDCSRASMSLKTGQRENSGVRRFRYFSFETGFW